jgi:hypothetical protein
VSGRILNDITPVFPAYSPCGARPRFAFAIAQTSRKNYFDLHFVVLTTFGVKAYYHY